MRAGIGRSNLLPYRRLLRLQDASKTLRQATGYLFPCPGNSKIHNRVQIPLVPYPDMHFSTCSDPVFSSSSLQLMTNPDLTGSLIQSSVSEGTTCHDTPYLSCQPAALLCRGITTFGKMIPVIINLFLCIAVDYKGNGRVKREPGIISAESMATNFCPLIVNEAYLTIPSGPGSPAS